MKTTHSIKSGLALGAITLGSALLPFSSAQAADLLVHFDFANGALTNTGTLGGTAQLNSGTQTAPVITEYATGQWAYDNTGATAMGSGSGPQRKDGSMSIDVGDGLEGLKSFTTTGWYKLNAGVSFESIVQTYLVQISGTSYLSVNSAPRLVGTPYYDGSSSGNLQQFSPTDSTLNTADQWVFFAHSFDALTGQQNFYIGLTPEDLVMTSRSTPLPAGTSLVDGSGLVVIGNRATADEQYLADNRPFKGMMKDIRIYGSTEDGSGALDLEYIKTQVMTQGMIPESSTYALIFGGVCLAALLGVRRRR